MDSDVKIGKADIEELMNESGESVKEPPKKHKRTGGEIALIAVCVLVMSYTTDFWRSENISCLRTARFIRVSTSFQVRKKRIPFCALSAM